MFKGSIPESAIKSIIFALDELGNNNQLEIDRNSNFKRRFENVLNGESVVFYKKELEDIKSYLIAIYSHILSTKIEKCGNYTEKQWYNVNKQFETWIYEIKDDEFEISLMKK